MRVLVTGTEGYIGRVLAPALRGRGHEVVGLDSGFYVDRPLFDDGEPSASLRRDIRDLEDGDLDGFDAVAHLAELSNDPLGQFRPEITYAINHAGTVALATRCKRRGVSRFVYTSSCSVYGLGSDDYRTEESPTDPQTVYARCKVLVERDLTAIADASFSPTFLRNATAYGPSPRMRFDLVLNNLAGHAWTRREIRMTSDGTPWRPLVHVGDICHAIACALEAPRETVHAQTFNVGDTRENFRVRDIARIVAETFPGCELSFGPSGGDTRSYRVSFEKIQQRLPGFRCQHTVADGAKELRALFERIDMSPEIFGFRAFTRLAQLDHLVRTGQLDEQFKWSRAHG